MSEEILVNRFVWRNLWLAACLLVCLLTSPISAADGPPLGQAEASALLTRLAEEWEQASRKLGNYTGEVSIEQHMRMSAIEIQKASLKQGDDPIRETLDGSFEESQFVKVQFRSDTVGDHIWCRWTEVKPRKWINTVDGSVVREGKPGLSSLSVVNEHDYFYYPSDSRVGSIGGVLQSDLMRLDIKQQRDQHGGGRTLVIVEDAKKARSLMPRAYVFNAASLLEIGGSPIGPYLAKRAKSASGGRDCEVYYIPKGGAEQPDILIRQKFTSGRANPKTLCAETLWRPSTGTSLPSYLMTEDRSEITEEDHVSSPMWLTTWSWDTDLAAQGIAFPKAFHTLEASPEPGINKFERHVDLVLLEHGRPFDPEEFSVNALEAPVGTLLYDLRTKGVKYIGQEQVLISPTPEAAQLKPDRYPGLRRFMIVFSICMIGAILWFALRKRIKPVGQGELTP